MPKKQKKEYPKYYINKVNGAFIVVNDEFGANAAKGLPLVECDKNRKEIK